MALLIKDSGSKHGAGGVLLGFNAWIDLKGFDGEGVSTDKE